MENKPQPAVKKPNFFKGINRVAKAMGIEKVSESNPTTVQNLPSLTPQVITSVEQIKPVVEQPSEGNTLAPEQSAAQDNMGMTQGTGESDTTQITPPVVSPPEMSSDVISETTIIPRSEAVPSTITVNSRKDEVEPKTRIVPDISMPSMSQESHQMTEQENSLVESLSGSLEALVLETDSGSYINPDGSIDSLKVNSAVIKYAQNPENIDRIKAVDPVSGTFLQNLADRGLLQNNNVVASGLKVISIRKNTDKAA